MGIDFDPTPEYLESLRIAGADESFLAVLRDARPIGKILVETAPGGEVWLNELSKGLADSAGQLTIQNVPKGRHRLRVSANGYPDMTQTIVVSDQAIIARAVLRPKASPKKVPDAETLYKSGLSAFNGGQYQLAVQSFQEYLQYYGSTDLASNAQFYIGESYYSQGEYDKAIEEYNKCVEQFPKGNKVAAAQLKKGYALLALDKESSGIKELRSLIQRFPNSREADLARQRLKKLGVSAGGR